MIEAYNAWSKLITKASQVSFISTIISNHYKMYLYTNKFYSNSHYISTACNWYHKTHSTKSHWDFLFVIFTIIFISYWSYVELNYKCDNDKQHRLLTIIIEKTIKIAYYFIVKPIEDICISSISYLITEILKSWKIFEFKLSIVIGQIKTGADDVTWLYNLFFDQYY